MVGREGGGEAGWGWGRCCRQVGVGQVLQAGEAGWVLRVRGGAGEVLLQR